MKKIAHRGLSALFPENTLLAFQKALEAGVYGIQTDLRITADLELVLSHDSVLEKIHAPSLTIEEVDFEQIKELDASSWFDLTLPTQNIPTLDQALQLIKNQCKLIIEIKEHEKTKGSVCKLLVPHIQAYPHTVEVSSFSDEILFSLHALNPKIPLHKLIDKSDTLEADDFDEKYKEIYAFDIEKSLKEHPKVRRLLEEGRRVIVWTIDEEPLDAYDAFFAVMSNNPLKLK